MKGGHYPASHSIRNTGQCGGPTSTLTLELVDHVYSCLHLDWIPIEKVRFVGPLPYRIER